ncbi:BnaC06g02300D [Brassica napus]|uniref:BnaC06g02300D protein n=1 Tax=Brassica napus TaxID=3708 RepID=A0A078HTH2_BRANA|nr:BnaC06g02300D [Brassica napus]
MHRWFAITGSTSGSTGIEFRVLLGFCEFLRVSKYWVFHNTQSGFFLGCRIYRFNRGSGSGFKTLLLTIKQCFLANKDSDRRPEQSYKPKNTQLWSNLFQHTASVKKDLTLIPAAYHHRNISLVSCYHHWWERAWTRGVFEVEMEA